MVHGKCCGNCFYWKYWGFPGPYGECELEEKAIDKHGDDGCNCWEPIFVGDEDDE